MLKPALTPSEAAFAETYAATGNSRAAARAAGCRSAKAKSQRQYSWRMKRRFQHDPRKLEAFRSSIQECGFTADRWAKLTMQKLHQPDYIVVRQGKGLPDQIVEVPGNPLNFCKVCEMIRSFTGLGARQELQDLLPGVSDERLFTVLGVVFRGQRIRPLEGEETGPPCHPSLRSAAGRDDEDEDDDLD